MGGINKAYEDYQIKKMDNKLTFYIVRHGKTLLNTLDKVQGWCDSPLTEEGISVARQLAAGMKHIHFDAAYTSDLRRTRQTAEILLKEKAQAGLDITEHFGFREACFGAYESDFNKKMWRDASLFMHYLSMEDMYKDAFSGKISCGDVLDVISLLDTMGMAENFNKVETRSQNALYEIAKKQSEDGLDKNILIVSHGMSIICMLYNMGGKELLNTHLENASVSEVVWQNGEFTVTSMGDMSYVDKGSRT